MPRLRAIFANIFLGPLVGSMLSGPALADDLTINFTNNAGVDVVTITAASKAQSPPALQSLLSAPITSGDTGTVTLQAANGECLFDLAYTFANGSSQTQSNTDLCQTDTIIVE